MIHRLKIDASYFGAVQRGNKTFELRREDDRHFAAGDTLILTEIDDPNVETDEETGITTRDTAHLVPTGRTLNVAVTYVLRNREWLQPGVAALGIRLVKGARQDKEVPHD